jgi:hypothetical protein
MTYHPVGIPRDGFTGVCVCVHPLALARGGAEGAVFHDQAKKYKRQNEI